MKSQFQSMCSSFADGLRKKRVSYRVFGLNKEYRRPIIHRFEIKDGDSVMKVMADNVTKSNPLLAYLMKKGK